MHFAYIILVVFIKTVKISIAQTPKINASTRKSAYDIIANKLWRSTMPIHAKDIQISLNAFPFADCDHNSNQKQVTKSFVKTSPCRWCELTGLPPSCASGPPCRWWWLEGRAWLTCCCGLPPSTSDLTFKFKNEETLINWLRLRSNASLPY